MAERIALALATARQATAEGRHPAALRAYAQLAMGAQGQEVGQLVEDEVCASITAVVRAMPDSAQASWLALSMARALPRCANVAFVAGAAAARSGDAHGGIWHVARAHAADPRSAKYAATLDELRGAAVERWHFRMVNDRARNAAYDAAIKAAVRDAASADVTVVDVGAGTGLLSLMAARAGAVKVTALEVNGALCVCAREVVAANGCASIHVVEARSTEYSPAPHSVARVDLIVSELVDSGLLGEGTRPTLRDAGQRFLKAGGEVIPRRAVVHVQGYECAAVARRAASGGDASFRVDEPYTCEPVADLVRTGRARALTPPVQACCVDLTGATAQADWTTAELRFAHPGRLDVLCVWFDLDLRGDGKHVVSTAPHPSGDGDGDGDGAAVPRCSGWDQALFYIGTPQAYAAGATASLRCRAGDTGLTFELDGAALDHRAGAAGAVRLGEMDVAVMNDGPGPWLPALRAAVAAVPRPGGGRPVKVVDLSASWTLTPAVAAAACGAAATVTSAPRGPARDRAVSAAGGAVVAALPLEDALLAGGAAAAEYQACDVLVSDIVEGSGLLRKGALAEWCAALTALRPAAVLPQRVVVYAQLVHWPALVVQRRACRENTAGFDLSALDSYGTRVFRELDLDLSSADVAPIAGGTALLTLDMAALLDHPAADDSDEGWTDDVFRTHGAWVPSAGGPVAAEGVVVHAAAYWFALDLGAGHEVRTRGGVWRQAAVVLGEGLALRRGAVPEMRCVVTASGGVDVEVREGKGRPSSY